jgi:hypothetical protein
MRGDEQKVRARRIPTSAAKAYGSKDFVRTAREFEWDAACYEERQGPQQQFGSKNHAPARLCHQLEPSMAGGEGIWMAETDGTIMPGKVTWARESGLVVRLQLRRA